MSNTDVFVTFGIFSTTGSSGTTAPASGTSETWNVSALSSVWAALSGSQTYAVVDAVGTTTEIIRVTACTGSGATSITVTRGADGTTPVAHASGASFKCVAVSSFFNQLAEAGLMPVPTASGQTVVSTGTSTSSWGLATAATVDTTDTPLPDSKSGNPGTNASVSSSNHSHSLSALYNAAEFGFPPSFNNLDFTFDGAYSGQSYIPYGIYPLNYYYLASLSGSTYTMEGAPYANFIYGRNVTLNSGITLKSANPGTPVIIVASSSITVAGTITSNGAPASGATGGSGLANGGASDSGYWSGFVGGNGATGAGGAGGSAASAICGIGGVGGAGGTTGASAGGAGGVTAGYLHMVGRNLMWLMGSYFSPGSVGLQYTGAASAGCGGGGGAGDGTHAGGGGGGGGGIILLIAPTITIDSSATLSVVGGAGAAGTGGTASGGGGGGGGVVAMHALDLVVQSGATFSTGGGAGGAAAGSPGTAGTAGSASAVVSDPAVTYGGRNLGAGVIACQWQ